MNPGLESYKKACDDDARMEDGSQVLGSYAYLTVGAYEATGHLRIFFHGTRECFNGRRGSLLADDALLARVISHVPPVVARYT